MGEFGAPPYCLFVPFVFKRAIQYFASLHGTLASQVCDRPYGAEQNMICRGDSRIARDVVRSIFRLKPMFAFNQSLPQWGKVAAAG